MATVSVCGETAWAWEPKSKSVASGKTALKLDAKGLTESSGLAFSRASESCLWSHNDSGGKAKLMAFGPSGKYCGSVRLKGIKANDWEDIASFDDDGPRLLVADVGDNSGNRESVSLYIFSEPNPRKKTDLRSFQHLVVRYSNGSQNCEAVAVDIQNRRILLLGKSALVATMHEVPLPARSEPSEKGGVTKINVQARVIGHLPIPLATGMDLCPKTGDLWISNYLHAFCYPANQQMTLQSRLKQMPNVSKLPKLKQIEAIAVDPQGRVWVTSEGKPAKLQRVLIAKQ